MPQQPLKPGRPVMKLFRGRAQRRKTDNWLQHRKSGATGTDPSPTTRTLYPQALAAPVFRSFSARSPITEAVKQRLRLKAAELLALSPSVRWTSLEIKPMPSQ